MKQFRKSFWLTTVSTIAVYAVGMGTAWADPFKDALTSAYEKNPRLKAEREALAALDESVAQAVSGWRPTISGNLVGGRQRNSFEGASDTYSDARSKQLVLEQSLFSGGETWARTKSAKDQVKAGQQRLKAFEQRIILEAVTAYMDVYQNQAVLELSRKNVGVLKKQLKASQDRFDVGEVTRTDVAQSEARLSAAESDRIQAEGNLDSSRAAFKRVVGYDAPVTLELPKAASNIPANLEEAVQAALAANPDYVAAQYAEKSADASVDVAMAALLPEVSLQGRMSRDDGSGTSGTSSLDSDSVLVNVDVPLYQSGAEYSRIRESKNTLQQRKHQVVDGKDAATESATRTWEEYQASKSAIKSRKDAIKAAEIALDGVKQEQQYGARTTLDVLDAEQELFIARVNLVRAERNEAVAAHTLLAAMGRLTAKDIGMETEIYDPNQHYDKVKYKFIGF